MDKVSWKPKARLTALRPIAQRPAAARLGWGLADQAVSSITNLVLGIVVARSLSAADFGSFSLAWVTYGVILNVSRGLATDPLTVRFSGVDRQVWRTPVAQSSGMSIMVGLVARAFCAGVGLLIGGVVGAAFLALAAVVPGLLLQDSWRFAFFASGQGGKAVISDCTWAATMVPLLLLVSIRPSVGLFVIAWGGSAA